jgi:hypothetical protein
MAKVSTFTCDAPDCDEEVDVPEEADPRDFGVVTVTINSKSVAPEDSVKHLIGDCEERFMDGSISGFDLFTAESA